MIQPLSYPRRYIYRTSSLSGAAFFEGVILHTPSLSYKYHVFLVKDGIERKKYYCKTRSAANRILEKCLKEGAAL